MHSRRKMNDPRLFVWMLTRIRNKLKHHLRTPTRRVADPALQVVVHTVVDMVGRRTTTTAAVLLHLVVMTRMTVAALLAATTTTVVIATAALLAAVLLQWTMAMGLLHEATAMIRTPRLRLAAMTSPMAMDTTAPLALAARLEDTVATMNAQGLIGK